MRGRAVIAVLAVLALAMASPSPGGPAKPQVRLWKVMYRAHDGAARRAFLVLPAWYGPNDDPPIPVVISPHGRGVTARANATLWGALPARGSFGVISPA